MWASFLLNLKLYWTRLLRTIWGGRMLTFGEGPCNFFTYSGGNFKIFAPPPQGAKWLRPCPRLKTISADFTDRTNVYNLHELQTNYFTFSEPDLNAPYNFWWHSSFWKNILWIYELLVGPTQLWESLSADGSTQVWERTYILLNGIPSHLLIIN